MSTDRHNADESDAGAGPPRVSLEHAEKARKHYGRNARAPREPDELGAVAVVDRLGCGQAGHDCGGRMAFFHIPGTTMCEVRYLDAAAPAPAAKIAPAVTAVRRRAPAPSNLGPLFGGNHGR